MKIISAADLTAEAAAYVGSLPRSSNPFLYLNKFVIHEVEPPTYSEPMERLIIAFAVIFALKFVFSVIAVVYFCVLDRRCWLFRATRDGIWQTNTRLFYAILATAFCAANTASLVRGALINQGKLTLHNRMALEGLRWIPLWLSGWVMVHSIATCTVQTYLEMGGRGSIRSSKPIAATRTAKEIALVWSLNGLCIGVPVLVVATIATSFCIANHQLNSLLDSAQTLTISLITAATRYNAATYEPSDLAPYLAGVEKTFDFWVGLQTWWQIGFYFYTGWAILVIAFFTPFFIRHLISIRRLMGAPSVAAAANPLWTVARSPRPSRLAQQLEEKLEAEQKINVDLRPPVVPARSDSDITCKDSPAPEHQAGSRPTRLRPAAGSTSGSNREQDMQRRALRADLQSVLWTAVMVFVGELIYFPLSLYAALTDVASESFWIAEIIWGNAGYIVVGLIANVIFVQRPLFLAWQKSRRKRHETTTIATHTDGSVPTSSARSGRRQLPSVDLGETDFDEITAV